MTIALVALAIAPGLALTWFFYKRDHLQPEPWHVVGISFCLGAFMVFPAASIESSLGISNSSGSLAQIILTSFFIVALVEEGLKLSVIQYYSARHFHFDEVMDGIVYGGAAAAGFATLENIAYVLEHGIVVGLIRAVLSVPMHILTGVIMGYAISIAKFSGANPASKLFKAFSIAVIAHGSFNSSLISNHDYFYSVPAVIVLLLALLSRNAIKQALALDSSPESTIENAANQVSLSEELAYAKSREAKISSSTFTARHIYNIGMICIGVFLAVFGILIILGAWAQHLEGRETLGPVAMVGVIFILPAIWLIRKGYKGLLDDNSNASESKPPASNVSTPEPKTPLNNTSLMQFYYYFLKLLGISLGLLALFSVAGTWGLYIEEGKQPSIPSIILKSIMIFLSAWAIRLSSNRLKQLQENKNH